MPPLMVLEVLYACFVAAWLPAAIADLWSELDRFDDLSEFYRIVSESQVAKSYLQEWQSKMTVFAPINDVFVRFPDVRTMSQKELLDHFVDHQLPQIFKGLPTNQTLYLTTKNNGRMFVTMFENNPGNYSYFANNGRVCNHVSSNWAIASEGQYLYKICSTIGEEMYPGTAFDLVKGTYPGYFDQKRYSNNDLTYLRDMLVRNPDVSMTIYGASGWNGFHTFFLPNNKAFEKLYKRDSVDRDALLTHVTGTGRVLFTEPWLYDYGLHYYPSLRFAASVIENNYKIMLTMRNITDRKTGRWSIYAVSTLLERYHTFRKGAVWGKIVMPNIPVQNGVVHVIDRVLGVVSNTIDQLLLESDHATTLMTYIYTIGNAVRAYVSAQGGLVTFFAPINEAFDRIPEAVERRLLRDRIWLEQILKLHIVPSKDLTTDQISNDTIAMTVDNLQQLRFIRGEWPRNNITYYVLGGGVKASIWMEDVSAINGIVHYIDRVLGVPYLNMLDIIRNDSRLSTTYRALCNMQLQYTLSPWEVLSARQNFTFFVPTDEAWEKVPIGLRSKFFDGQHFQALQFVMKRHLIHGTALRLPDLRERVYVTMNDQRIMIRRVGRYFELFWPYGNIVARLIEGGEIAAINGFMHLIDNVLILQEDLHAGALSATFNIGAAVVSLLFLYIAQP